VRSLLRTWGNLVENIFGKLDWNSIENKKKIQHPDPPPPKEKNK
jgi:hypothetical protein